MLYKVTPMMTPPASEQAAKKARREPGQPRKRRKTAIYDGEGHEVLITLMCLKCKSMKPLGQFGLRKMADGAIRNQPWCRTCRSAAGTKPRKPADAVEAEAAEVEVVSAEAPIAEPVAADSAQPQLDAVAPEETTQPMGEQTASESDGTPLPIAAEPGETYGGH